MTSARPKARDGDEDRGDRCERKLEAGVEQRVGVPREQDRRADEQEVPAVERPGREPRQRGERAGDSGPNDRRLPADRQDIPTDRSESANLSGKTRQADEPGQEQGAARDERDVLAGDGKQVIQARRTESPAQLVR